MACKTTFHVSQAFTHGREMLGSLHGIVEDEVSARMLALEQASQCEMHPPRACVEKASAELRLKLHLGSDPLLEADHFGPGQKSHHRPSKSEKAVAQRSATFIE
jgi:hypothetical protein